MISINQLALLFLLLFKFRTGNLEILFQLLPFFSGTATVDQPTFVDITTTSITIEWNPVMGNFVIK